MAEWVEKGSKRSTRKKKKKKNKQQTSCFPLASIFNTVNIVLFLFCFTSLMLWMSHPSSIPPSLSLPLCNEWEGEEKEVKKISNFYLFNTLYFFFFFGFPLSLSQQRARSGSISSTQKKRRCVILANGMLTSYSHTTI